MVTFASRTYGAHRTANAVSLAHRPVVACWIACQMRAAYGKFGLTFESTNVDVGSDGPYAES